MNQMIVAKGFLSSFLVISISGVLFSASYIIPLFADAYPNTKRPYFGNNFKLKVCYVSIWHCIQTSSHGKRYLASGTHSILLFYFLLETNFPENLILKMTLIWILA